MLRLEMEDLKSLDFDLELTGSGEEELARILEPAQIEGSRDPDSVPDLPSNPGAVPGDLWILDNHRLMCGDSTFVDQVQCCAAVRSAFPAKISPLSRSRRPGSTGAKLLKSAAHRLRRALRRRHAAWDLPNRRN